MKGLLIKDVYMLRGYCRVFILLMLIMFAALIFTGGSSFFILYQCADGHAAGNGAEL